MTERPTMGGTDGFRGPAQLDIAGPGKINEETFSALTIALVQSRQAEGIDGTIVIAADNRPSSARLKRAVCLGAETAGAEVLDMGTVPTPLAQKVAASIGSAATVVVTASHNKATDNGWKGMIGADKPYGNQVAAINDRYWDLVDGGYKAIGINSWDGPESAVNNRAHQEYNKYTNDVLTDIRDSFGEDRPLEGKIFAVDGANGAAGTLTASILERLGATVEEFATRGDGPINEGCGAADLSGLQTFLKQRPELMQNTNFMGAIANDGDADRMMALGVVNGKLVEVNGNHAMWALAQGEDGIVGTHYTNSGLVDRLHRAGIGFEYCDNGDVNVTRTLRDMQTLGQPWSRGGEFTGHHIDLAWLSSGDGVRMAAWFATWASQNNMTFGDVYQELPLWHEVMQKIDLGHLPGKLLQGDEAIRELDEQLSGALGSQGRIYHRASGTEPVYRIWGESVNMDGISKAVQTLKSTVAARSAELAKSL